MSQRISRRHLLLSASLLPALCRAGSKEAPLLIDSAFPGGNIRLDKTEGDAVFLRPDPRGGQADWFYWYFRVQNAGGRTLTFRFPRAVMAAFGPAISLDGGKGWQWLGTKSVVGSSFTYCFPSGSPEVRFSVGMPYVQENLRGFLERHRGNGHLRREILCQSEQGREVELLRAGRLDGKPAYRMLLTARHHACEMMASYVMEGFIEAILAEDGSGAWYREAAEVLFVPFVDKDGVENGDQGKGRSPHDHNRDYKEPAIYASVRALRDYVPRWARPGLDLALDIHCPTLRDDSDQRLAFIAGPFSKNWARVEEFCRTLEAIQQGPLPYRISGNMLYGQLWNVDCTYADFDSWATQLAGDPVTTTLEVPYANASGQPVTADSARAFGRDLAVAVCLSMQKARPRAAAPA